MQVLVVKPSDFEKEIIMRTRFTCFVATLFIAGIFVPVSSVSATDVTVDGAHRYQTIAQSRHQIVQQRDNV